MIKGILSFILLISLFLISYYWNPLIVGGLILFDFTLLAVGRMLGVYNPKATFIHKL